jgi:hypothetical protein
MAASIESLGHVKMPHQRLYQSNVKVEVDLRLRHDQQLNRLEGFSLRMLAPKATESAQPEICINLSVEQYFSLLEAMKRQLDAASEHRSEAMDSELPD